MQNLKIFLGFLLSFGRHPSSSPIILEIGGSLNNISNNVMAKSRYHQQFPSMKGVRFTRKMVVVTKLTTVVKIDYLYEN
jgi:hypothetical protein